MDAGRNASRTTTIERTSDREVTITRTFDAPVRIVFAAWSKPEVFLRWWVPKSSGVTVASSEMDIRTGGSYRLMMCAGERTLPFFGKYLEVTPNARMVWTNEESGDGQVTTATFEEKDGKTLVVVRELYPTKEACDAGLASGAYDGMSETHAQLDELLLTLM